jgi:hypothetical protein
MLHAPARAASRPFAVLLLCAVACGDAAAQSPLTIGNLFVVRFGDGTAPLTNASTATFVDEYTPGGTLVQTIALPIAASGANRPLTSSGAATTEGFLNVSTNGIFLTLAGYAVGPGLVNVASTAAAATPRVVARIDLLGTIDTSTTITDGYSGAATSTSPANIRSAVATDGSGFWTSGTGVATSAGVRWVQLGASTSIGIGGNPANARVVGIHHGQLYTTSTSGAFHGVAAVGSGVPTTPGQVATLLPGMPATSGPSPLDFWFADPQTLYVADDRGVAAGGGIQKWTLGGGTWSLQYTLAGAAGCRGVTGFRRAGATTLWATTTASQLVTVVDTGAASAVTVLASAPANTAFRGVRVLGKPPTLARVPAACGSAGIVTSGNAEIGTDVVTTIVNPVGVPFVGYGLNALGAPLCGCIVLHDFLFVANGPQHTLSLPFDPALLGFVVWLQGLDFLAPGGCPGLPFTLTDGYTLVVQ